MNNTVKKLLGAAAGFSVLAFAPAALAATAVSADGDATAYVIKPLSLAKSTTLNFGKFAAGTTGGTVVISTANARSFTGDVQDLAGDSTNAVGTFTLGGEEGAAVTISLPAEAATLTHTTDNTKTMTVSSFVAKIDSAADSTSGTIGAGGNSTITVGATLNVGAGQAPGTYDGTCPVSVDYQ